MKRAIQKVIGFLESVLVSCFFACFRVKDVSHKTRSIAREDLTAERSDIRTELSSKEKDDNNNAVLSGGIRDLILPENYDAGACVNEDLIRQAEHLKNCGAIQEIPLELQTCKLNSHTPKKWSKLSLDGPAKHELPAQYHIIEQNELTENSDSSGRQRLSPLEIEEDKSSGCLEGNGPEQILEDAEHLHSSEPEPQAATADISLVENYILNEPRAPVDSSPPENGIRKQPVDFSNSPYATPLVLTDEMQTPATVCRSYLETSRTSNLGRVHRQYVYPVLNPAARTTTSTQDVSKVKETVTVPGTDNVVTTYEPSTCSDQGSGDREETCRNNSIFSNTHISGDGVLVNFNPESATFVISNISSQVNKQEDLECIVEKQHMDNGLHRDRPINGVFTANWQGDTRNYDIPKWFDGNGIPNSTTKYKEDQKVNWHATPFEERLDKALSDEKFHPTRKLFNGRLIELDE